MAAKKSRANKGDIIIEVIYEVVFLLGIRESKSCQPCVDDIHNNDENRQDQLGCISVFWHRSKINSGIITFLVTSFPHALAWKKNFIYKVKRVNLYKNKLFKITICT